MSARERVCVFECAGHELVGIVSDDAAGNAKTGLLLVPGAPQYRVGAHRQFVLLARRLAAGGFAAMRFDYRGTGDAGGPPQTFCDTTPDIAAALAKFEHECPGLERIVLLGLCDGASACALYLEATADPRVAGMVLLNPWTSSDQQFARAQIGRKFRRVLDPDFWARLVCGRVDLAGTIRSLTGAAPTALRQAPAQDSAGSVQALMAAGADAFRGRLLIILSRQDLIGAEFAALAQSDPVWQAVLKRENVECATLADADHTFSATPWRETVETTILGWLDRAFAATSATGTPGRARSAADRLQRV